MKRLVCATLVMSLLGATAASAAPYGRGYDRGTSRHHGGDNTGALIGLGIGLFAIGAIMASQNNDRDRYDDRYRRDYYQDRGYQDGYRGNYQDYRGNGYRYGR